jgi:hypothetical protein
MLETQLKLHSIVLLILHEMIRENSNDDLLAVFKFGVHQDLSSLSVILQKKIDSHGNNECPAMTPSQ